MESTVFVPLEIDLMDDILGWLAGEIAGMERMAASCHCGGLPDCPHVLRLRDLRARADSALDERLVQMGRRAALRRRYRSIEFSG